MNLGDGMPDYKELYLKLFHATEQATNVLIAAQRECEELYVSQPEPALKVIAASAEKKKDAKKE